MANLPPHPTSTLTPTQVAQPGSEDAAWYTHIAERAFHQFITHVERVRGAGAAAAKRGALMAAGAAGPRISARARSTITPHTAGTHQTGGPSLGGLTLTLTAREAAKCDACIRDVAITLISHLGNVGGREEGTAPQVVVVCEGLLTKLVAQYPGLHWDYDCLQTMLGGWGWHGLC